MNFHAEESVALFIDGANLNATARALGFEIDYAALLDVFAAQDRLVRAYFYTSLCGSPTSSAKMRRRAGFCGGSAMLMVNEYHPFRRIWSPSPDRLELACGYFERGPHRHDRSGAVPGAPPGSLPSYEFNWTVADYVTALMHGGCELEAIREIGDQREWWESAPLAGLPNALLLVGRKR